MKKFDAITIHCSASPNDKSVSVDEIRAWHKERGWSDIGYHCLIDVDGVAHQGRPFDQYGAHVHLHNTGNLGICLVGTDKFSLKQFETLRLQVILYQKLFLIPEHRFFCHYEWDTAKRQGKSCPNIRAIDLYVWVRDFSFVAIEKYLSLPKREVK